MVTVKGNILHSGRDGLMIATPTAEGSVSALFAACLARAVQKITAAGRFVSYRSIDMAEVSRARNILAALFLSDPQFEHLLFIDNDIGFPSDLPLRLLRSGYTMVGAACPSRTFDKEALANAIREGETFDQAMSRVLRFNVYPLGNAKAKDGFIPVSRIGTAFLMIHRSALSEMIEKECVKEIPVDRLAKEAGVTDGYYDFFDMDLVKGVSEDLNFCDKYVKSCNGRIHACIDEVLTHEGLFRFSAAYSGRD